MALVLVGQRVGEGGADGPGLVADEQIDVRHLVAVADSVAEGVIPRDQCENLVIVCGVFIHWQAEDDKKIYDYNYQATKLSIARAMKNEPSASEMLAKKASSKHPFYNA